MALPGTRDGSLRANAEAKFQNNNLPSKDQAPVFQLQCLLILVTRFVQGSYDGTNIPELDTSRQVVRSFVGHGRVACFLVISRRSAKACWQPDLPPTETLSLSRRRLTTVRLIRIEPLPHVTTFLFLQS